MNIRLLIAFTLGLAGIGINAQVVDQAALAERTPDEIGGNYRTWSVRGADDALARPSASFERGKDEVGVLVIKKTGNGAQFRNHCFVFGKRKGKWCLLGREQSVYELNLPRDP